MEEKLSSRLDFNPSGILQADLPKSLGLECSCTSGLWGSLRNIKHVPRTTSSAAFQPFFCATSQAIGATGVYFHLVLKWGGAPDGSSLD